MMDAIEKSLLEQVSGLHDIPAGAYSLRINGAHHHREKNRPAGH